MRSVCDPHAVRGYWLSGTEYCSVCGEPFLHTHWTSQTERENESFGYDPTKTEISLGFHWDPTGIGPSDSHHLKFRLSPTNGFHARLQPCSNFRKLLIFNLSWSCDKRWSNWGENLLKECLQRMFSKHCLLDFPGVVKNKRIAELEKQSNLQTIRTFAGVLNQTIWLSLLWFNSWIKPWSRSKC